MDMHENLLSYSSQESNFQVFRLSRETALDALSNTSKFYEALRPLQQKTLHAFPNL